MPNEEVEAFKLTDTDNEPVHWLPAPDKNEIACDTDEDTIDFDEAEAVSIQQLLDIHSGVNDDVTLCEDCDEVIAEMMSR